MQYVNRERELGDLDQFWQSGRAECIPVTGRRRVGKTVLLEHFSLQRRVVYYRCQLAGTPEQLPQLGAALVELAGDPVLRAQPPTTWPAIFALVESLTRVGRTLLVLDEIPYWVARDETLNEPLRVALAFGYAVYPRDGADAASLLEHASQVRIRML